MRILLCHNYYSQRGGEDQSFEDESRVLVEGGHQVEQLTVEPQSAQRMPKWQVALRSIRNQRFAAALRERIARFSPDVVHFTNTFPLISPASIRVASQAGCAVVQSLRNYRLVCPAATLFRDGSDCQACLGKRIAWPAVVHGCYRGRTGSATVAGMTAIHNALGTWSKHVDHFYTLSETARAQLIAGGLPENRLSVKPNFLPDPGYDPNSARRGAIFVGRLVAEKGVRLLLEAWRELPADVPLTIVGEGPLAEEVATAESNDRRIQFQGALPHAETIALLAQARLAIVPSLWSEPFGRVVIEAFALGTPVVVSDRGAFQELVSDGRTGRIFCPTQPEHLTEVVAALLNDDVGLQTMSQHCRQEYLDRYSPQHQAARLTEIYRQAIDRRATRPGAISQGSEPTAPTGNAPPTASSDSRNPSSSRCMA